MLKPGTYKLTADVENPKPDRRVKEDWRAHVTWKAGDEFIVQPVTFKERDDKPASTWVRIVKVGHRWTHHALTANDEPQFQALTKALVSCEMSNAAFFTEHDVHDYFARWLIESGRTSRELFLKLWGEHQDDGELHVRDPYPQRPPLVESAAKRPLNDPGLRDLFAQLGHGIETIETAVRGLRDEIAASTLVDDAIAEHGARRAEIDAGCICPSANERRAACPFQHGGKVP